MLTSIILLLRNKKLFYVITRLIKLLRVRRRGDLPHCVPEESNSHDIASIPTKTPIC